jgi:hypothetical protein
MDDPDAGEHRIDIIPDGGGTSVKKTESIKKKKSKKDKHKHNSNGIHGNGEDAREGQHSHNADVRKEASGGSSVRKIGSSGSEESPDEEIMRKRSDAKSEKQMGVDKVTSKRSKGDKKRKGEYLILYYQ